MNENCRSSSKDSFKQTMDWLSIKKIITNSLSSVKLDQTKIGNGTLRYDLHLNVWRFKRQQSMILTYFDVTQTSKNDN